MQNLRKICNYAHDKNHLPKLLGGGALSRPPILFSFGCNWPPIAYAYDEW